MLVWHLTPHQCTSVHAVQQPCTSTVCTLLEFHFHKQSQTDQDGGARGNRGGFRRVIHTGATRIIPVPERSPREGKESEAAQWLAMTTAEGRRPSAGAAEGLSCKLTHVARARAVLDAPIAQSCATLLWIYRRPKSLGILVVHRLHTQQYRYMSRVFQPLQLRPEPPILLLPGSATWSNRYNL